MTQPKGEVWVIEYRRISSTPDVWQPKYKGAFIYKQDAEEWLAESDRLAHTDVLEYRIARYRRVEEGE